MLTTTSRTTRAASSYRPAGSHTTRRQASRFRQMATTLLSDYGFTLNKLAAALGYESTFSLRRAVRQPQVGVQMRFYRAMLTLYKATLATRPAPQAAFDFGAGTQTGRLPATPSVANGPQSDPDTPALTALPPLALFRALGERVPCLADFSRDDLAAVRDALNVLPL